MKRALTKELRSRQAGCAALSAAGRAGLSSALDFSLTASHPLGVGENTDFLFKSLLFLHLALFTEGKRPRRSRAGERFSSPAALLLCSLSPGIKDSAVREMKGHLKTRPLFPLSHQGSKFGWRQMNKGPPRWLGGKEPASNVGDLGSIPGLGKSPGGEAQGNPL